VLREELKLLSRNNEKNEGGTLIENGIAKEEDIVDDGNDLDYDREEDGYDNDDDGDDGWGDATIREEDIIGDHDAAVMEDHPLPEGDEEDEDPNDEWSPLEMKTNPLGMNIELVGVKHSADSATNETQESRAKEKKETRRPILSNKLEPISHDDNLKRKSERMQKKQAQLTAATTSATNPSSSTAAAAAAKQKLKTEQYFHRQQESIRETLKTNEERIAEATYLKLQERLQNVDELLESLQEEEWAEEEEEEEEGDEEGGNGGQLWGPAAMDDGNEKEDDGVTLLDQILAMILGGLPPEEKEGDSDGSEGEKEHYKFIMEEHKQIVKGWKEAFGRLPPFPSSEEEVERPLEVEQQAPEPVSESANNNLPYGDSFPTSPKPSFESKTIPSLADTMKKELNLVDNEDSHWDEVEDWDAMFP